MSLIESQLILIANVCDYINKSPKKCRQKIIENEENNFNPVSIDVVQMVLRWFQLHLIGELHVVTESMIINDRGVPAAKCKLFIEGYFKKIPVQEQENFVHQCFPPSSLPIFRSSSSPSYFLDNIVKEPVQLDRFIQEQLKLIFSYCLTNSMSNHLSILKNHLSIDKYQLSPLDILEGARTEYNKSLCEEALLQFEIYILFKRFDHLIEKVEKSRSDPFHNIVTINGETKPEINEINKKFNIGNLKSFKLQAIQDLWDILKDKDAFEHTKLIDEFTQYMDQSGTASVDPCFGKLDKPLKRTINQYFGDSGKSYDALKYYTKSVQQLDFLEQIVLPTNISPPLPPIETDDLKLIELRQRVSAYVRALSDIEKSESLVYAQRSSSALSKRKALADTLNTCVNRADSIGAVKDVAHQLVTNIKALKPTWQELPLLDKILDIISLGGHALYRFFIYKELEASKQLANTTCESVTEPDPHKKT